MAVFHMKIAGAVGCVQSLFESAPQYFRAYLTQQQADFSIAVRQVDLRFEQAELDREAAEEGFRFRVFTDPFLERAAIQRAFAEYLFDKDVLLIHGSAVALDGRGYLFMARSGILKTNMIFRSGTPCLVARSICQFKMRYTPLATAPLA